MHHCTLFGTTLTCSHISSRTTTLSERSTGSLRTRRRRRVMQRPTWQTWGQMTTPSPTQTPTATPRSHQTETSRVLGSKTGQDVSGPDHRSGFHLQDFFRGIEKSNNSKSRSVEVGLELLITRQKATKKHSMEFKQEQIRVNLVWRCDHNIDHKTKIKCFLDLIWWLEQNRRSRRSLIIPQWGNLEY